MHCACTPHACIVRAPPHVHIARSSPMYMLHVHLPCAYCTCTPTCTLHVHPPSTLRMHPPRVHCMCTPHACIVHAPAMCTLCMHPPCTARAPHACIVHAPPMHALPVFDWLSVPGTANQIGIAHAPPCAHCACTPTCALRVHPSHMHCACTPHMRIAHAPTTRVLHFGSTNPCRITRNVEQTKMYVCTLKNIYSSRYLDALLYKLELNCIGICRSLYTIATIEEKG